MNIDQPLTLLGGLTPAAFMRRYWQRKPLLIRQAIPGYKPTLSIADIKQLAKRDEVESRLIWQDGAAWKMKKGPFSPSATHQGPWLDLAGPKRRRARRCHRQSAAPISLHFRCPPG